MAGGRVRRRRPEMCIRDSAYPFAVAEPAEPFDRVAYFINGSPYPVGLYPVPLGLGGLEGRPDEMCIRDRRC